MSASEFKRRLFLDGLVPTNAENSAIDGSRLVASLLAEGLALCPRIVPRLDRRDPRLRVGREAALLGEGKPVKLNDHSLDAGEYAIKTHEVIWRAPVRQGFALAAWTFARPASQARHGCWEVDAPP